MINVVRLFFVLWALVFGGMEEGARVRVGRGNEVIAGCPSCRRSLSQTFSLHFCAYFERLQCVVAPFHFPSHPHPIPASRSAFSHFLRLAFVRFLRFACVQTASRCGRSYVALLLTYSRIINAPRSLKEGGTVTSATRPGCDVWGTLFARCPSSPSALMCTST